jgi:hypothetical protein
VLCIALWLACSCASSPASSFLVYMKAALPVQTITGQSSSFIEHLGTGLQSSALGIPECLIAVGDSNCSWALSLSLPGIWAGLRLKSCPGHKACSAQTGMSGSPWRVSVLDLVNQYQELLLIWDSEIPTHWPVFCSQFSWQVNPRGARFFFHRSQTFQPLPTVLPVCCPCPAPPCPTFPFPWLALKLHSYQYPDLPGRLGCPLCLCPDSWVLFLLRWNLVNFFAQTGLELSPSQSQPPK